MRFTFIPAPSFLVLSNPNVVDDMTTYHTMVSQLCLDPKFNSAPPQSKQQFYTTLLATTTLINDEASKANDGDGMNLDLHIDLGLLLGDLELGDGLVSMKSVDDDEAMDVEPSLPSPEDLPEPDTFSRKSINTNHLAKTHHTHDTQYTAFTQNTTKTHGTTQTTQTQRTMSLLLGLKRKLKRYSMFKQDSEEVSNSTPEEPSQKRFSFGGTLQRIKSNRFINENFIVPTVSSRTLIDTRRLVLMDSLRMDRHAPYWKYHVLRYGRDLYLTTNPDTKHLYCRNGPGFYVEVIYFDKLSLPDPSLGFNLIFKDMAPANTLSRDAPNPVMIISKKPQSQGGYFTLLIPMKLRLARQAPHLVSQSSQTSLSQSSHRRTFTNLSLASTLYNGLVIPKGIPLRYLPPGADEAQLPMANFEFKDCNNVRWNVGLIPRLRSLGFIGLKTRLWVLGLMGGRSTQETLSQFVGKHNVYFHQNYIVDDDEDDDDEDSVALLYKESNPLVVSTDDGHSKFPPVLAVFRPNDQKMHKKISKLLHRNRRPGSLGHVLSKIRGQDMEEDLGVGLSVNKYYTGGDGLYFVQNPLDDSPDDDKLGWITVYEDDRVFGSNNPIMFDIVVGLTLAAGLHAK